MLILSTQKLSVLIKIRNATSNAVSQNALYDLDARFSCLWNFCNG